MKKIMALLISLITGTMLNGGDFVTIDDPIASSYGTVTADPLIMSGTSSQPNVQVRLFFNGNETSSAYTDEYGNWSSTSPYLNNGTYTLTAILTTFSAESPTMDTVSFTVDNGNTISINNPTLEGTVFINPILLSGSSSLANATINISLDGTLVASTTTDANGNWQHLYTLTAANGAHTVSIDLLDTIENTTTSNAMNIISNIPFMFPAGISQARFVNGDIPTSGSGRGPGYIYTVSGSSITINFIPAFTATPSLSVTGLRPAGSATVSLTSASPTAATLTFSSGTQAIHFSAAALQ
jgi:large repetitive protein